MLSQGNNYHSIGFGKKLSFFSACAYCASLLIVNLEIPILPHILFAVWLVCTIGGYGSKLSSILSRSYFKYFYVFIVYYFLVSLLAFNPVTCVNRVITKFELISPFIMFELYLHVKPKLKLLFVIIIGLMLFLDISHMYSTIMLSSGLGLKQHFGDDDFLDIAFNIIYSISLLPGFFVYKLRCLKCEYNNKRLIIILLNCIIIVIFSIVTLSMYATALFIMIFGIVLGLIYNRKRWILKFIFAVVGLLMSFYYLFPLILYFVSDIIPDSKILLLRFEEVFNFMSGHAETDASSTARTVRMFNSLNTFFEYPLFGVTHLTDNFSALEGEILGNHTEWIDDMALYGIFAFSFFAFLFKSIKKVNNYTDIIVLAIPFVTLGFFNQSLFFIQMFIVFFYAPYIGTIIDNKKIRI